MDEWKDQLKDLYKSYSTNQKILKVLQVNLILHHMLTSEVRSELMTLEFL